MRSPVTSVENLNPLRLFSATRQWLPKHTLAAILLLAFVLGSIYLAVIPPWWHYDEPGHFEYVWLAGHSPTWPVAGQYDSGMRRQMADSLAQYGWYRIRNIRSIQQHVNPIFIGVPQTGDQPGYYFLASLPVRLLSGADITMQYTAARAVSFLLFLLIVVAAWYALGEFLPDDSLLRWMTSTFIAILPAFVDTMISVNNDVSAVLAATLALWACLRLIQKGFSAGRILFVAASLAACYLSKATAWFVFALAPAALVLAFLRGRFAGRLWAGMALVVALLFVFGLQWGSPRAWYGGAARDYPARVRVANGPLGGYAFQLDDSGTLSAAEMLQIMTPDAVKAVRGKTATLGVWVWASRPTTAGPIYASFMTRSGEKLGSAPLSVEATTRPTFHQIVFSVPNDALNGTVYLKQTPHGGQPNDVFFDGLVLVPGEFANGQPSFTDANGTLGEWNGSTFRNLLRNASAEAGAFELRKSVDDRAGKFFEKAGIILPIAINTIQDWSGTGWYYRGAFGTLFRTFWASLGGDKAFLLSSYVSYVLLLLTLLGVAGAAIFVWRRRHSLRWDLLGFLGLWLLMPWLLAIARGSSDFLWESPLFPWARYAFPAIVPTALLICSGWLEWLNILSARMPTGAVPDKAIFLGVMLGITAFALMNAIDVFHPDWQHGWLSLVFLFLFQYAIFRLLNRPAASRSR